MTAKVSLGINVIFYFSAIVTVKVTLQAEKKNYAFYARRKRGDDAKGKICCMF